MNGRSKREYDGTYILSPFDTIIGGRVGNCDSHAADLSQDVESTSFASGYRAKVAGYRSRVGQESVYGFRLLSGEHPRPLVKRQKIEYSADDVADTRTMTSRL